MRSIYLFLLFELAQGVAAQTWQWSSQIGGPGDEYANIAGVDASSAVYLYGSYFEHWNETTSGLYIGQDTLNDGNASNFIAKYNADGTLLWLRSCTSIVGIGINNAVVDTLAGKLYVVGVYATSCVLDTLHLYAPGPYGAAFLSQWNLEGRCLWARNVALSGADLNGNSCSVGALTVDGEGRVLVGGRTAPVDPNLLGGRSIPQGTFTAAYTTSGDTLWTHMVSVYHGTSPSLVPIDMQTSDGHVLVYNAFYMDNTTDTLLIADSVITGYSGGGYGLFRMNSNNGNLDWFTTDGWPQGPADRRLPHRLALNDEGDAFIAGSYGIAFFGTDTLDAPGQSAGGFIARYDTLGSLLWVRGYEAISGSVGFSAIARPSGGGLQIVGSMVGTVNWDGIAQSSDPRDLLLAAFSETGECVGIESDIGPSTGMSICPVPDGLYITGIFPPYTPPNPPFLPITIGSSTYNTFGWTDAFVAKHSLNVGVGIPSYRSVEADGLLIYANPNRGSFQVQLPDAFTHSRNLVLHVYDSTGRMVLEQQLDMRGEPAHMDVFDAVPGLYNVTVTDGHSTCSGSMVVE